MTVAKTIRYHVDPVALRDVLEFGRNVYLPGEFAGEKIVITLVCDIPGGVGYPFDGAS